MKIDMRTFKKIDDRDGVVSFYLDGKSIYNTSTYRAKIIELIDAPLSAVTKRLLMLACLDEATDHFNLSSYIADGWGSTLPVQVSIYNGSLKNKIYLGIRDGYTLKETGTTLTVYKHSEEFDEVLNRMLVHNKCIREDILPRAQKLVDELWENWKAVRKATVA